LELVVFILVSWFICLTAGAGAARFFAAKLEEFPRLLKSLL